jgi:hypothetical protein
MKKLMFLMLFLGIVSGVAMYTTNLICSCGDDECTSEYSSENGDEEANVDSTCPPAE